MKILVRAAIATISLGIGTAMAQDGSGPATDYWGTKNLEALTRQPAPQNAGSSLSGTRSSWLRSGASQNGSGAGRYGS